jgi:hypothetical protein
MRDLASFPLDSLKAANDAQGENRRPCLALRFLKIERHAYVCFGHTLPPQPFDH